MVTFGSWNSEKPCGFGYGKIVNATTVNTTVAGVFRCPACPPYNNAQWIRSGREKQVLQEGSASWCTLRLADRDATGARLR